MVDHCDVLLAIWDGNKSGGVWSTIRKAQKADKTVSLCFIWTSDRLLPTAEVMKRMANLLTRLVEKLSANDNKNTPQ